MLVKTFLPDGHTYITAWHTALGPAVSFRAVPAGGGQVFRLISRCNFSPFFKREGPQRVLSGVGFCLSRGKVRARIPSPSSPSNLRTERRRGSTFPVKLALNSSSCITFRATAITTFSRDNSIITLNSQRSAEEKLSAFSLLGDEDCGRPYSRSRRV